MDEERVEKPVGEVLHDMATFITDLADVALGKNHDDIEDNHICETCLIYVMVTLLESEIAFRQMNEEIFGALGERTQMEVLRIAHEKKTGVPHRVDKIGPYFALHSIPVEVPNDISGINDAPPFSE